MNEQTQPPDALVEISKRMDTLRSQIAEGRILLTASREFIASLLAGLERQLPPGTPRTVAGIVDAVANMALKLDAHEDASTPAFDEIVKLCGLAKTWEYPAQVVRDVEDALKKRDDKIAALRAALVYARDRRGPRFDFDEWILLVDAALEGKVPEHAVENAQANEARAWVAVANIRVDRDLWKQRATTDWSTGPHANEERVKDLRVIEELREKLRVAEIVRDDARRVSQRYLDEKRAVEAAGAELVALVAKMKPVEPTGPQHSTDCGTRFRGRAPWCEFAAAQKCKEPGCPGADGEGCIHIGAVDRHCPWVLDDEDPDEGYWHCKHTDGHDGVHETEFGAGRDRRWREPVSVTKRECECSPTFIELAPGIHAGYCPLAGQPLADNRRRWVCGPCRVTFRAAAGETTPIDRCIQCGGSTRELT